MHVECRDGWPTIAALTDMRPSNVGPFRRLVLLALVGCGVDPRPPAAGDAAVIPDVDDDPGAVHLTVNGQPPTFIAYRDGTAPWQTPRRDSHGGFALHVKRDYRWVVVCTQADHGFDAELGAATLAD